MSAELCIPLSQGRCLGLNLALGLRHDNGHRLKFGLGLIAHDHVAMREARDAGRKAPVGVAAVAGFEQDVCALLRQTLALGTLPDVDMTGAAMEMAVLGIDRVLETVEADVLGPALADMVGVVDIDRVNLGEAVLFVVQSDREVRLILVLVDAPGGGKGADSGEELWRSQLSAVVQDERWLKIESAVRIGRTYKDSSLHVDG